jgi:chloramphenicol 3-O phosphotransferase
MNHLNPAKIIFLNGASSSGKSTIAKLLQRQLDEPFLHMQLDAFIEMLPRVEDELFLKMIPGFHRAIAAMAATGNNVIVDHVLVVDEWLQECRELLTGYVLFVGVQCPLDELERREKERDKRRQGFARSQFENVHKGKVYDIEIDTSLLTPKACAQQILDFYHTKQPGAFRG